MHHRITPFLRWAGGKQWLVNSLIDLIPKDYAKYYEPFLGGGALYFALKPENATLGDVNRDLIEAYLAIQANPSSVIRKITQWSNTKPEYYKIRQKKFSSKTSRAARFIFLNKTCWNGLYRVNKQGDFNVPFSNNKREIIDPSEIKLASELLKGAQIVTSDFEDLVSPAQERDLVYLDPPYTVAHSNNGFRQYNEKLFSWEDQVRLANVAKKLADKGCYVIVSNALHSSIEDIYPTFQKIELERHSILAASTKARKKIKEALFLSRTIPIRGSTTDV